MLEWLNRLVSKTSELARVPRVRIPVSPPASRLNIKKIEYLPKCPAVSGALRLTCVSVSGSAYFPAAIWAQVSVRQRQQYR